MAPKIYIPQQAVVLGSAPHGHCVAAGWHRCDDVVVVHYKELDIFRFNRHLRSGFLHKDIQVYFS